VTAPALKCSTSKALSGRSVGNLFLGGHNKLYAAGSLGTYLQFIHVRRQTLWGSRVANRFTNLFQELLQRSCRSLDEEELAHLRSHVLIGVHRCPGNIDHGAGTSIDLALAEDELELAFEDVVGLILATVQMRRAPPSGGVSISKIPTVSLSSWTLKVISWPRIQRDILSPEGKWLAV
jgi:hypothetical protein